MWHTPFLSLPIAFLLFYCIGICERLENFESKKNSISIRILEFFADVEWDPFPNAMEFEPAEAEDEPYVPAPAPRVEIGVPSPNQRAPLRHSAICLMCQFGHGHEGRLLVCGGNGCQCIWLCDYCGSQPDFPQKMQQIAGKKAAYRLTHFAEGSEEYERGLDPRLDCQMCHKGKVDAIIAKCRKSIRKLTPY